MSFVLSSSIPVYLIRRFFLRVLILSKGLLLLLFGGPNDGFYKIDRTDREKVRDCHTG